MITTEEIVSNLEKLKREEPGAWVIKHNGVILTLPSNKSIWKKKNHAGAAFTNYINAKYRWKELVEFKEKTGLTNKDSIGQYLIKQGIVTVEQL